MIRANSGTRGIQGTMLASTLDSSPAGTDSESVVGMMSVARVEVNAIRLSWIDSYGGRSRARRYSPSIRYAPIPAVRVGFVRKSCAGRSQSSADSEMMDRGCLSYRFLHKSFLKTRQ